MEFLIALPFVALYGIYAALTSKVASDEQKAAERSEVPISPEAVRNNRAAIARALKLGWDE